MTRRSAQHLTARPAHRALLAAGLSLLLGLGVTMVPSGAPAVASGDPACGPLDNAGRHQVSTLEHLENVGSGGTGGGVCGLGAKYIQTDDIDLISVGNWLPIGSNADASGGSAFNGEYDGGFYRITNLTIDRKTSTHIGLFRELADPGKIHRVRLENVDVHGSSTVGGLVGRMTGLIENSSVTGTVRANAEFVGGIVGQASTPGKIINYNAFIGLVEGGLTTNATSTSVGIGGIVGRTSGSSEVSDAYVRGTVKGNYAGGIVGSTSTANSVLKESYASVVIDLSRTDADQNLGGAIAGRVESSGDDIQSSVYWNTEEFSSAYGLVTSGSTRAAVGRNAAQMQGAAARTNMGNLGWSDNIWQTVTIPDDDFPVFSWQRGGEVTVTVSVSTPGGTRQGPLTVRGLSRDGLFENTNSVNIPVDSSSVQITLYQAVHQQIEVRGPVEIEISGELQTVKLTAVIQGPFINRVAAYPVTLQATNLVVGSQTSGVTVSDSPIDPENPSATRTRTFTAASATATLSAQAISDGLFFGNVKIVAAGNITVGAWETPAVGNRTLTLKALGDIATSGSEVGLDITGNTLTVVADSEFGSVSLESSGPLTLGKVEARGPISVVTATGNLVITDDLITEDTTDKAIVLGAGVRNVDECTDNLDFSVVDADEVFSTGTDGKVRLFTWTTIVGYTPTTAPVVIEGLDFAAGVDAAVTEPVTVFLREGAPTISVSDFDALLNQPATFSVGLFCFTPGKSFQVFMQAANGTLDLSDDTDVVETPPLAKTDAQEIRFNGSLADIRAAVTGMTFTGTELGEVIIQVTVSELASVSVPDGHPTYSSELFRWTDGNGHFYEYVSSGSSVSWTTAKQHASERTLFGAQGYLATLTSLEENNFAGNSINATNVWIGLSDDVVHVNPVRPENAQYANQAAAEGNWHWVTGPEAGTQITTGNATPKDPAPEAGCAFDPPPVFGNSFNAWACGEPNNSDGAEHYAVTNINLDTSRGLWNDLPVDYSSVKAFLVEYSAADFTNIEDGDETFTVTVASLPETPTNLGLVPGNQQLGVTFTEAASIAPIIRYEYTTDGRVTSRILTSVDGQFIITTTSPGAALVNGTTYNVEIRAVSTVGASAWTASVSGTPAVQAPAAPTALQVSALNQSLQISFTPGDDGGAPITNYLYSTDNGNTFLAFDPPVTSSPVTISTLSSDNTRTQVLQNGTSYTIILRAENEEGPGLSSESVTGTPVAPVAPVQQPRPPRPPVTPEVTTGVVAIPGVPSRFPSGTTPIPTPSAPLTGPVITPGVTPQAPATPTGTVGGVPVPTQSQVTGTNQLQVTTGVTSLGLTIPQGGGQVSSGPTTEIALPVGGSTSVNASGLLPGSRVQVFIPLAGGDFRELAPLAVNQQGQASGDIVFAPRTNEPPLPIGRQVMQIISVDETGQRVTVDMAVVIAQGSPTPEVNREDGTLPTLPPGRSLATEAGLPVPVTVVVDQDLVTTVITGDGWSFAVDVSGEGSQVRQTPDGEVFLSVTRGSNAEISGFGFMPNTRADVWLFSDPTLLGTLDVDEQGEVSGQVNFDARVIAQGNHTIQIQGVGTDGFIRAASLGVEVADPTDAPAVDSGDSAVSFIWWALAALLLIAIITAVVLWSRNRAAVN